MLSTTGVQKYASNGHFIYKLSIENNKSHYIENVGFDNDLLDITPKAIIHERKIGLH